MSTSHTFRLFISSTFSDFQEERTLLQTKIFPEIKEYAATKGYIFQPVDLRWGVSNEVQLDQKTLELCLSEVRACKTYPHPNFLVMLGDRYGWLPLPYAIEQEEFERVLSYIEDKELLNEWYKLDTNQIPASYIIKERSGEYEDFTQWSEVESKLRSLLQSAVEKAELSQEQKRKYFLSATEAEVEEGIIPYLNHTPFQREELLQKDASLDVVDPQHIFGFFRDVEKSTQIEETFITDDYEKAQEFKEKVAATLPSSNRLQVKTRQIDTEHLDREYLEEFQTRVTAFLKEQIDTQKNEETIASPLEVELAAQAYYANNKRKGFIGQKEIQKSIADYIRVKQSSEAFVLYGRSGSGKSALMAKLIEETENSLQQRVLYRFVSATPNSSSSKEILISLFDELGKDIRGDEEESFEDFSERVSSEIESIEEDVVIFIDAVDQLQNDDSFLWLPQQLPSNVKIVISALSDANYEEDSKYLEALSKKIKNIHQIPEYTEAKELLYRLLATYNRSITTAQEEYFLQQYAKVKSPLYVTIAVEEMRHYKSSDVDQTLADTQRGIIEEFIENLTTLKHHNREFVTRVLGYIYVSIDGLSESELLQLLSQDETFVQKMAPETWHANPNKELPLSHWSRLHTELKPFLSLKKVDNEELLYFFNREFEDVVANKVEQEQEHNSIIKATQRLILKNQDKEFDANRWGKLYITLITEYELRYHDKAKQKEFALFLADSKQLQEEWIDKCIGKLVKIGLNYSEDYSMFEAMAYLESAYYATEKLYEKNNEYWSKQYTKILDSLAYVYYEQDYLDDAIDLAEESLEIVEKNLDSIIASNYVKVLNNLVTYYYDANDLNEAIALEEKSLSIKEELFKNNFSYYRARDYVTTLTNLANYYNDKDHLDEAIELGEKSCAILDELYKVYHYEWTIKEYSKVLCNLASSYSKKNHLNKAIKLGEKSLVILEKLYEIDLIQNFFTIQDSFIIKDSYGQMLSDLADYYSNAGRLDEAIELGEKSLIILENPYDYNKISYISRAQRYIKAQSNLSIFYYNKDRLDEAVELKKKSLNMLEKLYIEDPMHWAEFYTKTLNRFATFYYDKNYLNEAVELKKKSLAIAESLYEEDSIYWAELYIKELNNLATFYDNQNHLNEAILLNQRSLDILEEIYMKDLVYWAEDYTIILNNLASSYYNQNCLDEAIKLIEQSLIIAEDLYNINSDLFNKLYPSALNNLLDYYYKKGQNSTKVLDLLYKNYEFHKKMYGEEDPKTLEISNNINFISNNSRATFPVDSSVQDANATLKDLLYLSKFIALVNAEEKISMASFVNAFGFIDFNEGAKVLFSQVVDLDTIKTYENALQHIQKVKELPQIKFDEDLKELVSKLKKIFGDETIGTLR